MVHPYDCARSTLSPAAFLFFGDPADLEMRCVCRASCNIILASLLWFSAVSNTVVVDVVFVVGGSGGGGGGSGVVIIIIIIDDCDKDVSVMVTGQGSPFLQ
jgi:hypothetical protein